MNVVSIESSCKKLASIYRVDLNEQELVALQTSSAGQPIHVCSLSFNQVRLLEVNVSRHRNYYLRIYLTFMPTNCTGEQPFSKLKIIKNHLRSEDHYAGTDVSLSLACWTKLTSLKLFNASLLQSNGSREELL